MKDDVNDEMPNGIPKTLIPFDGVVNWDEFGFIWIHQIWFLGWLKTWT